ncbi:hypothetical protein RFI_05282 [Reticulomyxa filosa]|uniref:Uncharacterized protein n=1 Tax=Reticulomyxa filosa TaxID=46433 RepID=X6P0U1_RETFI|nr:hypothetical protein RFI_05282 [Reticulomyxa filosa]|eukprot:ETO31836.1 hypothetical protein RFI_05282 [Reticulomyxa filosa]
MKALIKPKETASQKSVAGWLKKKVSTQKNREQEQEQQIQQKQTQKKQTQQKQTQQMISTKRVRKTSESDHYSESDQSERSYDDNIREQPQEYSNENDEKMHELVDKEAFIDAPSRAAALMLRPYIDSPKLRKMQAEFELSHGNKEQTSAAYHAMSELMGDKYVQTLREEIILEFEKSNPTHISVKSGVTLQLKAKNVKSVLVKVYRMNSMNYLTKHLSEIASDLNLEGLYSSFPDKEISVSGLDEGDEKSAYAVRTVEVDLQETLKNKRGLFFVDCIANGKHCRALVRKGDIRFLERKTSSGHVFTLFNECNEVVLNGGIILDGIRYETQDKSGEVVIPFAKGSSSSSQNKKIILFSKDWGDECSVLGEFDQYFETYSLNTSFWIEREQMLDKNMCHVAIRSVLQIHGVVTSIEKLLCNASLDISMQTHSSDNVKVNRTFNNLEMSDSKDCVVNINEMNRVSDIACAHLIPICSNEKAKLFHIFICGKNGEPLKRVKCTVELKHVMFPRIFSFDCVSDDRGIVELKNIFGIATVTIRMSCSSTTSSWSLLGMRQCIFRAKYHVMEHEKLFIPYFFAENKPSRLLLTDTSFSNDYSDKTSYTNGYIAVQELKAGDYELRCDYDKCKVSIHVCKQAQDTTVVVTNNKASVCLEGTSIYELSDRQTLQIQRIEEQKTSVRVYLAGVNAWTRVHIMATHFMPMFPVYNELKGIGVQQNELGEYHGVPTLYCKGREISEEYRYVLERAGARQHIGNLLQKPSLLVRPFSDRATTTETQDAKKGETIEHKKYKPRRQMVPASQTTSTFDNVQSNGNWPVIEFLGNCPAVGWYNLVCKEDKSKGLFYVEIDSKDIHEYHHVLAAVAVNDKYFSIQTHVLESVVKKQSTSKNDSADLVKYRDVRMYPGLHPEKHFVEQRQIDLVKNESKEDKVLIDDFKISQAEVFESIEQIFSLFNSLSRNPQLAEWAFLYQWKTFNDVQKLQKFNKYLCHEFNFFIYCKDRPFFDEFILPLVRSKVHKTLLDHWFLGDLPSLLPYLNIGVFRKLNAIEQILLCFAFKADTKTKFVEYFNQRQQSIKPNPYQFKSLFEAALANRSHADSSSAVVGGTTVLPPLASVSPARSPLAGLFTTTTTTAVAGNYMQDDERERMVSFFNCCLFFFLVKFYSKENIYIYIYIIIMLL